jgi:ketosteroid isomerase-like protein
MTQRADTPQDIARLFLQCLNEGNLDGLVSLYESDAVLVDPTGAFLTGHEQIRDFYRRLIAQGQTFEPGIQSIPLVHGDLALTSSKISNGDITAEVARRQADGSWRWVLDQPSVKAGRAI